MSSKTPIVVIAACIVAAAAGYALYGTQQTKTAAAEQATLSVPKAGSIAADPASGASDIAPADLAFTDLEGKRHALADYKGKLLVVNFWATWCGPCLHEIPALIKAQTEYGSKGLQLVGPAVDDPEDVKAQAKKLGFNYPIFVGESDGMLDIMTKLGNTSGALPFSVVIGPDGKILERQLGEFSPVELAGLIETHLKPAE
jgi:thiol-disulfide isomerase/thioredoxin